MQTPYESLGYKLWWLKQYTGGSDTIAGELSHLILVKHTDRFDIPKALLIYDNMDSFMHYTEQPTPNKHTQMQICVCVLWTLL